MLFRSLNLKTVISVDNNPYCKSHKPAGRHTQVTDSVALRQVRAAPKAARAAKGVNQMQRQTFAPGQMKPIRGVDARADEDSKDVQTRNAPQQRYEAPEVAQSMTYNEPERGLTGADEAYAPPPGQAASASGSSGPVAAPAHNVLPEDEYGYGGNDQYAEEAAAPAAAAAGGEDDYGYGGAEEEYAYEETPAEGGAEEYAYEEAPAEGGEEYYAEGGEEYAAEGGEEYYAEGGEEYAAEGGEEYYAEGGEEYAEGGEEYYAEGGEEYYAEGGEEYADEDWG